MYAREEGAGLVLRWQVELRQRFFAVKHAARPFETRVMHQVVADIDRRIVEIAARHVFAVQRRFVNEWHVVAVTEILEVELPVRVDGIGSTTDAHQLLWLPRRGALSIAGVRAGGCRRVRGGQSGLPDGGHAGRVEPLGPSLPVALAKRASDRGLRSADERGHPEKLSR